MNDFDFHCQVTGFALWMEWKRQYGEKYANELAEECQKFRERILNEERRPQPD